MGTKEMGLYFSRASKTIEFQITPEKVLCAVTCLSCSSVFGISGLFGLGGAG